MTPTIIEDTRLQLPEDIQLWQHAPDFLVLAGPGLTRERYIHIKDRLPEEIRDRVHGWRKLEGRRG